MLARISKIVTSFVSGAMKRWWVREEPLVVVAKAPRPDEVGQYSAATMRLLSRAEAARR